MLDQVRVVNLVVKFKLEFDYPVSVLIRLQLVVPLTKIILLPEGHARDHCVHVQMILYSPCLVKIVLWSLHGQVHDLGELLLQLFVVDVVLPILASGDYVTDFDELVINHRSNY